MGSIGLIGPMPEPLATLPRRIQGAEKGGRAQSKKSFTTKTQRSQSFLESFYFSKFFKIGVLCVSVVNHRLCVLFHFLGGLLTHRGSALPNRARIRRA
jgi:hypothetical protein